MINKIYSTLKKNQLTYGLGIVINIIFHNLVMDSFRYLRYLLIKLKLLKNTPYQKIEMFKDIHKGKRCFIVATGPSLTFDDLSLLKDEFCFSVNSIIKTFNQTEWRPTYYGIQDANVYEKLEEEIRSSDLGTIFVGHQMTTQFSIPHNYIPYFHFTCFHGRHRELVPRTTGFSNDASKIVHDGYSVTYSMLQLAVYMGFSEIYLLGTDCNYSKHGKQHFVASGWKDKNAASVGELMIYAFPLPKSMPIRTGSKFSMQLEAVCLKYLTGWIYVLCS